MPHVDDLHDRKAENPSEVKGARQRLLRGCIALAALLSEAQPQASSGMVFSPLIRIALFALCSRARSENHYLCRGALGTSDKEGERDMGEREEVKLLFTLPVRPRRCRR